jgi:peroxiredoxin
MVGRVRAELGVGLALVLAIATAAALWGSPRGREPRAARGLDVSPSGGDRLAPDFELPDLRGRRLRLQDLRGHVVLLNFWATWCGPCQEEMPAMERLARDFADRGLLVVAVNHEEAQAVVADFVRDHGLTFPVLLDPDGGVAERYRVVGLPTSYVIDHKGVLVGSALGFRDWNSRAARGYVTDLLPPRS